jgi:hypothetical protein
MTRSPLQQLFLLAAGADITVQEFRAFVRAIRDMELDEVASAYSRFRNRVRHIEMSDVESGFDRDLRRLSSAQIVRHDITALVQAAKLRPADAAERIRNKLMSVPDVDPEKVVPYSVKEGFGRWVDRLASSVGASILLNAAISALASEKVGEQLEWRLSKP